MLFNYLKIALRGIIRQKSFAAINLLGLSIGISCALLISMWVRYELNFDHFHRNIDHLHRVVVESNGFRTPTTPGPMAAFLEGEIPEIVKSTRFKNGQSILQYGEKSIKAEGINAEPAFFDLFTFPAVSGDARAALDDASSIVLCESAAKKLFGEENPIGKVVKISNKWTGKIAAVVRDVPRNSSPPLKFEYLSPFKIYYFWRDPDNWEKNSDYNTWVLLDEKANLSEVNIKIDQLVKRHNPDPNLRVFLQPVKDIHLNADTHRWDGPHGDMKYVLIFSLLAVIILGIACMNFMNLSTARSLPRAREVGIRKVSGASRGQLMKQYFGESLLFALLALPLSILWVELFLPYFNNLAGRQFMLDYGDPYFLSVALFTCLITGIISGIYPALFLSAFKPVKILKSPGHPQVFSWSKGRGVSFRKVLVVLQFTLSVFILISTFTVTSSYIHSR